MAERIYNFCKKYHAKTQVMVSGIRKPAGKNDSVFHSCEAFAGAPFEAPHHCNPVHVSTIGMSASFLVDSRCSPHGLAMRGTCQIST